MDSTFFLSIVKENAQTSQLAQFVVAGWRCVLYAGKVKES
jgi:hypothetical protein